MSDLRCDLQAEYHIDIDEFFRGAIRLGRLADLTAGLPLGSRTSKMWSQQENLLADIVDLLNRGVWLSGFSTQKALGKQARNLLRRPPRPMKRPGQEKPKPKPITPTEDAMRMLGQKK